MLTSRQIVNSYARRRGRARPGPLGLRGGEPAARRPRLRPRPRAAPTPASSPTRTSAWPTSSSPTAPGSTSTTRTPSTHRRRCTNPLRRRALGQGRRAGHGRGRRSAPPQRPGARRSTLYKNNTDNKGASYGTHENYLMRRATPFADIVRHLTPFFVTRQVFTGAGRVGIGQDGREHGFQISQRADFFEVEVGLETTLKRPIINTRDEPHADAEQVPPAARDHRRRQPLRDLDVPQGRHHRARARDDRGRLPRRRPRASTGRSRAARGLATTRRCTHLRRAARRPQADRASSCRWSTSSRPASTSRTATAPTPTSRPATCWTAGSRCSTGSRPTRCAAPTSSTGSPSSAAGGLPRPRRAGLGRAEAARDRPAVLRRAAREGALPPAGGRAAAMKRLLDRGRDPERDARAAGGHPRVLPRPLPARSTPTRWPPRPGTR